jgi:NAD(P)H-dependent FMN reductase
MKVLALNGSPRSRAGATSCLIESLLAGMAGVAGTETELVNLAELYLQPCRGCYTCWAATPGKCVHGEEDGMARVMCAWREADLVVFGTPLYHFSMTGLMKTFLDRLLPESEPWLMEDPQAPGWTMHPRRHDQPASALLVSPCGFPEADQFAPLVQTFRYIAERHHWTWLGELLRPGADVLSQPAAAPVVAPYLADVRRAGAALVAEGGIPAPLREALGRDLLPGGRAAFYQRANQYWEKLLSRAAASRHPDAASESTTGTRGGLR